MVEIRNPIQVEEAVAKVMAHKQKGEFEYVDISLCDNRHLAEGIVATYPIPAFDKSPYDGFAFKAADTSGASPDSPVTFQVVDHIGAGHLPEATLQSGQATRIMTGAQIPDGADCVAMFERCDTFEKNNHTYMSVTSETKPGDNIIKTSSEISEGEQLLSEGTIINPGVKALLATFGYKQVKVAKQPLVGVIATGTELLEVDEPLEPGKIRNSNAYMIAAQVKRAGAVFKYYGQLPDELEPSMKIIDKALEEVDILVTTGGVSVGDFDLMPAIYEQLGADVLFNKVAMRPGSVTTVAVKGNQILYGLSGNPSACYVGFELFARPLIRHRLYSKSPFHNRGKAVLKDDFPKSNPFTRFVRTYVEIEKSTLTVRLAGIDKSNVVSSLPFTTSLMVLPGGTEAYKAGDEAEVLLLEDTDGMSEFKSLKEA
ncbi:Molybdopterin molybdotransferase [Lentibacillus sp. JNUCC-1]|uniref:molybdopterin molybdotransferase MoeA n=1 Tax=Lentibacillus sp. JNUCC-1 TaxID=2654513 RepID=UPI0012E85E3C|nr:gephyrin-like molybdotransferase Glp [Lentibacillus sp. JNUCC-1]MUV36303.1 Molybdopterin molybdotransferase [Lentibacillus sp. JNUCC-1]